MGATRIAPADATERAGFFVRAQSCLESPKGGSLPSILARLVLACREEGTWLRSGSCAVWGGFAIAGAAGGDTQ